jgi:GTPase
VSLEFKVAIVGRPNVGKSTLFNRLVGKKLALVDDRPGVTRDRREGDGQLADLKFTIVDTAGLEEADKQSLSHRMRLQTEEAIADCQLIFFMIDARAGVLPEDRTFAELVRKSGKDVILIANKAEGKAGVASVYDAFSLGLGDPVPFSAEHGEGLDDLYQQLRHYISDSEFEEEILEEDRPISVAIMGRPNAGKSTLINSLIGEERLLVGPEAGITRDSISVNWEWKGKKFKLVDTAGLRKRAKIDEKLEKLSTADAVRALKYAEVVVVCMDITKPFEEQDLRIADLVSREGRAVVLAFTKSDMVPRSGGMKKELREQADHWLPQIKGMPVVPLSSLVGDGLDDLMNSILKVHAVWNTRIATSKLNKWLEGILTKHPPPAVSGRRIKMKYITQIKARPPTFVSFCSRPEEIPTSYERYLVNSLRETFTLHGAPIRLQWKKTDNPFEDKDKFQ